jgi:transposase
VVSIGPWLGLELGRKDVISVEDWAEIRRLHRAEGLSIREITRRMAVSRNTVRAALRAESPRGYVGALRPWAVDAFEPAIWELLAQHRGWRRR